MFHLRRYTSPPLSVRFLPLTSLRLCIYSRCLILYQFIRIMSTAKCKIVQLFHYRKTFISNFYHSNFITIGELGTINAFLPDLMGQFFLIDDNKA